MNDELELKWIQQDDGDRWSAAKVRRRCGVPVLHDILGTVSKEEYFRLKLAGQLKDALIIMDIADKYGVMEYLIRAST